MHWKTDEITQICSDTDIQKKKKSTERLQKNLLLEYLNITFIYAYSFIAESRDRYSHEILCLCLW